MRANLKTPDLYSDPKRMARSLTTTWSALGVLIVSLLAVQPALAQEGPSCDAAAAPSAPGVSLILLASPERVHTLAASLNGAEVVLRDARTVIFADGRVISADAGSVGDHLTALGWTDRKIEVVASFRPRAARPGGYG